MPFEQRGLKDREDQRQPHDPEHLETDPCIGVDAAPHDLIQRGEDQEKITPAPTGFPSLCAEPTAYALPSS